MKDRKRVEASMMKTGQQWYRVPRLKLAGASGSDYGMGEMALRQDGVDQGKDQKQGRHERQERDKRQQS